MKKTLNEAQLKKIVAESVKSVLKEMSEERPVSQLSFNELLAQNGWKVYRVIEKNRQYMIISVVRKDNGFKGVLDKLKGEDDMLDVDDLIEDINIYFEDTNRRWKAESYPLENETRGAGIKLSRI